MKGSLSCECTAENRVFVATGQRPVLRAGVRPRAQLLNANRVDLIADSDRLSAFFDSRGAPLPRALRASRNGLWPCRRTNAAAS
jgi:hypothetical protein